VIMFQVPSLHNGSVHVKSMAGFNEVVDEGRERRTEFIEVLNHSEILILTSTATAP
jgi:hypothetical protein